MNWILGGEGVVSIDKNGAISMAESRDGSRRIEVGLALNFEEAWNGAILLYVSQRYLNKAEEIKKK